MEDINKLAKKLADSYGIDVDNNGCHKLIIGKKEHNLTDENIGSIFPKFISVDLALKINKYVHDNCKDVPHDIGLKILEIVNLNNPVLDFLKQNTEGVYLNANDFFNYACADLVLIDARDLAWVIPFCNENPKEGISAVMSFVTKKMPINPHINPLFLETLNKLEQLNPTVFSDY